MKHPRRVSVVTTLLLAAYLIPSALAVTPPSPTLTPPTFTTAAATPTPKAAASKRLWNLENADIRAVIAAVAKETGKNFIINPQVRGNVSIISSKAIDDSELYQVFLSMLEVLGYSAIPTGNVIKIVPNLDARQLSSMMANDENPGEGDEWVVRVIAVNNVPSNQLVPILRPMMPEWSTISAYPPTNELILAGRANNIDQLAKIISDVDRHGNNQIEVVPLQRASAQKVLSVLKDLQSADREAGKVNTLALAADDQTNRIILSGSRTQRLRMRVLIAQLDTQGPGNSGNTQVVHLNFLTADKLAPILSKVAQAAQENTGKDGSTTTSGDKEVSIQAEKDSNSIIINAPPALMATLQRVIRQVDRRPDQVLVEAIIAQIDENQAKKLGATWSIGSLAASSSSGSTDSTGTSATFESGTATINATPGVKFLRDISLQAIVKALNTNSAADILSTPSVMVLNNQEAKISVGKTISIENREYATADSTSTSTAPDNSFVPFTTLERQNVALVLKVTPQISPDNTVRLTIEQSNNSLENPDDPGTQPVVNTADLKTSVIVNSGEVLVLGGLISHELDDTTTKIPLLGDLPFIGSAFKLKNKTIEKKNLLVFLRPVIIHQKTNLRDLTSRSYDMIRNAELKRWHGQSTIDRHNEVPLLPALYTGHIALPAPFEPNNGNHTR